MAAHDTQTRDAATELFRCLVTFRNAIREAAPTAQVRSPAEWHEGRELQCRSLERLYDCSSSRSCDGSMTDDESVLWSDRRSSVDPRTIVRGTYQQVEARG